MTHAVLRGQPTEAQFYLDGLLNEVLVSRGEIPDAEERERVSLPQILFYCLAKNLEDVFMINSETGEKITNAQILKQALSLARKLESEGARGKMAMVVMFSDQTMMAVFLALLFAGVVPLCLLPTNTVYEISHFLKLIEPSIVFCGERYYKVLKMALESLPELQPDIKFPSALPEPLVELNVASYRIADECVDDTVVLVPTSGSTGLPKACCLTHRGFIAQLATTWYRIKKFPRPTSLALVTTSPEGIHFSRMVTSCIVFSVPVLLPYRCRTVEWVKSALLTYRVLLPKSAVLEETYGLTEAHSVVAASTNGDQLRMTNFFQYKLVDEDGNTLGLCATGELCLKGPALAKGYYKQNDDFLVNGWFKTGDQFYIDEEERLFFQGRKSTCFKFMHAHVSPEEVEGVINAIAGVSACVVCPTERGAAAAVVASGVTREHVHKAVNDALRLDKRLHGGVGFVPALPVLHSGKLDRVMCVPLVLHLVATGECY